MTTIEAPSHVKIVNGRWVRVADVPPATRVTTPPAEKPKVAKVAPKPTRPIVPPADVKPFVPTAAWRKRRATKISKVTKAGKLYDAIHRAWRAGAVSEFGYGTLEHDDVIVWMIDGHTWAKEDLKGVQDWLDACMSHARIVSAEWGPQWCGYRSLIVTHADGKVTTDEYVTL